MKNFTAIFLLMVCATACNSGQNSDQDQPTSDTTEMKAMIPESNCYMWSNGRDTILLKVEIFPNVVTGVLKYRFAEKDNNQGTLEGQLRGDRLVADYTFESEGRQSVRQVAFKLEKDSAFEGYGDMEEQDGKLVFKDTAHLDFSAGPKLTTISCVDNDEQFRITPVASPL